MQVRLAQYSRLFFAQWLEWLPRKGFKGMGDTGFEPVTPSV